MIDFTSCDIDLTANQIRKEFYSVMIQKRMENILEPAYKKEQHNVRKETMD